VCNSLELTNFTALAKGMMDIIGKMVLLSAMTRIANPRQLRPAKVLLMLLL